MSPLPPLVMRTIIQTISLYPKLIGFTMTLLSRLITKQIWNDKRLWEGFIKCCKITEPHSLPILLQIPSQQLESALQIEPEIKTLLIDYCKANGTSLPSSVKSILGIQ
jgi:symplekin